MHAHTITYDNYLDKTVTETYYFNISAVELAKNLELRDRMDEIQRDIIEGPKREISPIEIRVILTLVQDIMKLSYGERSEDGLNHRKSPAIWDKFESSAAYDAMLLEMFEDTNIVYNFFVNIMPKKLRAEAEAQFKKNQPDIYAQIERAGDDVAAVTPTHTVDAETGSVEASTDNTPAYIRENRAPTSAEIKKMTKEELQDAFTRKLLSS